MKITSDTIWYAVRFPLGNAISKKVRSAVWEAVFGSFEELDEPMSVEVVSGVIEDEVLP